MEKEPIFDVAQLAHVEIFTPKPDETLWFFKDLLGMQESGRQGQSVYLRAYEDFYHHTLKVTEAKEPGLGHVAWRTTSPQALDRRVKAIKDTGLGTGWFEGENGHGAAYQFRTPDGHRMELLWEVDYYQAPEDQRTPLLNRPQKRPTTGVPVRRLDHVNLMASDLKPNVDFMMNNLGFNLREHIRLKNGNDAAAWMSVSPLVHEIAMMGDPLGGKARMHHICYWYGYPQHLSDISDILVENNIRIDAGPGKHGVSQAYFLYVFEPGGNRVELFGDAGYLIFDPAWKPIMWQEEDLEKGIIWYGSQLPQEFFMYGTPIIDTIQTTAKTG
ncbi:catechol 2,3-dioxygenase [Paenibacillus validus]|uniref:catechol 2,3-dioxygenase n=1 Tax=Paenibacillus TaxID=44249 RepID=UPI000FDB7CED|nr:MULTISPECIES: catechol 2,3-dioxygenase [Paenibacillus]MED4601959.1 catechol 2,3-dioxygenase [Paenibacillus validus]MED4606848.1 catechol 2,3-dioxygenase [Paenibacillus validus]